MKTGIGRAWVVVTVAAALFFTACSPGGAGKQPAGASAAESGAVAAPTGQPLGPLSATVVATPQVVEAPATASSLLSASVASEEGATEVAGSNAGTQGGKQEAAVPGAVTGLVADFSTGQVLYLVVTPPGSGGNQVLLPWGAFTMTVPDPIEAQAAPGSAEDFRPKVTTRISAEALSAAPAVTADMLEKVYQLSPDWDATTRRFWNEKAPGIAVTSNGTEPESAGSLAFLRPEKAGSPQSGITAVDVTSAAGEKVGAMNDMVVDPDGKITFAVITLPKLPEMGNARLVVDWQQVTWDGEQRSLALEADDAVLRAAPRFDPAALPDTTIPGWDQDWHDFWTKATGLDQTAAPPQDSVVQLQVSRLIGMDVLDPNAALLGKVEDLILGQEGAVSYLVVRAGDLLRPVPWIDFTFDMQKGILTYLDDVPRLNAAPGFATSGDLDTSRPNWDGEIRSYWGIGR